MPTRYFVSYRPTNGRPENFTDFGSYLARSLFIISLGPQADILRQWEAATTDMEHLGEEIDRMVAELPAVRERIALETSKRLAREAQR
jgi:hypothetical protein